MIDEDNNRLQSELDISRKQLEAVRVISAALASKNDVHELLRETLRVSLETVDADAGSLMLYNKDRKRLIFRHVIGKEELVDQEIDPETQNGNAAEVFRSGKAMFTSDTNQDNYDPQFDSITGYKTQSILTVPLKNLGSDPIGVLQAINKRNSVFTVDDQNILEIVGCLAATVIVNADLAKEAELAAVSRAVGDLGHDIKNALTLVQPVIDTTQELFLNPLIEEAEKAEILLRDMNPEEAEKLKNVIQDLKDWLPEANESIQAGCEDIREMVSAIADYIKGTQSSYIENQLLSDVIPKRLGRLKTVARTRRVMIDFEGIDTVPSFSFDYRLVGRALYNLTNNALGAIESGVKKGDIEMRNFQVKITASVLPEVSSDGFPFCRIEVADDGPGIPEEIRRSLFTSAAISSTPGGTGIGTRFVRDVAAVHGGRVSVENEPGGGARFFLDIPMRQI